MTRIITKSIVRNDIHYVDNGHFDGHPNGTGQPDDVWFTTLTMPDFEKRFQTPFGGWLELSFTEENQ